MLFCYNLLLYRTLFFQVKWVHWISGDKWDIIAVYHKHFLRFQKQDMCTKQMRKYKWMRKNEKLKTPYFLCILNYLMSVLPDIFVWIHMPFFFWNEIILHILFTACFIGLPFKICGFIWFPSHWTRTHTHTHIPLTISAPIMLLQASDYNGKDREIHIVREALYLQL